ncbi:hypothetical protein GNI_010030 [Gregarina niphandrodes]|uniref:Uncharacterized protein n=1 Tax=Gregarina niphandrodes TaxID=110365 RepID=A0A023BCZ1_GRENI|nr:hypothetical protein GNI_010030 [Gregarina niphandrodes]EZG86544.1 hypothetical protein GNI_010030 [Gregarina niphandrodes]|eukprot:XP_011128754.1 hypothetical protein GNI_010030 [Gregarina niphandrodes]
MEKRAQRVEPGTILKPINNIYNLSSRKRRDEKKPRSPNSTGYGNYNTAKKKPAYDVGSMEDIDEWGNRCELILGEAYVVGRRIRSWV